jgi:serine/threonine protein phosphatase PrpC
MQDEAPKYTLKFETGALTHAGLVRKVNEDAYASIPEYGVWAVADGVGGYEAGEVASGIVAESIASIGPFVSAEDQLARFMDRILRSNDEIRRLAQERDGIFMGSTVAAVLIAEGKFTCVWSGDSRVYRIRNGVIEQISHDHSEVQELLDQGVINEEEAKDWPRRNVITRAVGVFEDPDLETREGAVESGDVFVLCSDGLTGHVSDDEIRDMIVERRPQMACEDLIETTLSRGAKDNVTIVIVRCHKTERTNFMPGRQPSLEPLQ